MTTTIQTYARIVSYGRPVAEDLSRRVERAPTIGHGACCASCAAGLECESTCAAPIVGESPAGTSLGLRTKDAIAYADRLDRYVEDLASDVHSHVAYSTQDPSKLAAGLGLPADDPKVLAEVKRLKALQAGKGPDQLAREASFAAAWRAWKLEWDNYMLTTVSPWRTSITATAKESDWKRLEATEAEIMQWRAKYQGLGYAPSKPAPTSAEIEASAPKGGVADTVEKVASSVSDAVKYGAAAVLGLGVLYVLSR
jgi:hypothetical protein